MKYIVILGDGMADIPVPELGNKTPLQYANKPNMNSLAQKGEMGLVKTIPQGMHPGSDIANISTMGFDPSLYYTGRSPLEAVSMGIQLKDTDVTLRCNLVTLSEDKDYFNKTILDHSADEITTEEANELIGVIQKHFNGPDISFYPGVSYRHCMVWSNGHLNLELVPPHDILDKVIGESLSKNHKNKIILDMMEKSYPILKDHPINRSRIERGLKPANSIWLWGEGKKPSLPSFEKVYGKKGSVISAVDLIKGIGMCAGLKSVDVKGATGNINTNFKGKAEAALEELKSGQDFVYIHVEAPDECGHRQEIYNKVKSIELIDKMILGTLLDRLKGYQDYRIMILPDHPTPLAIRTHTSDPVPYLIYDNSKDRSKVNKNIGYDEVYAKKTGIFIEHGHELMSRFILS
ncbi:MAG: cofactor-independent phosphoglycerate mutase [Caldicoprobacterales bacterium]|nr:cofactor-independent phosphoglycerate mutase [Clostridiales bacterium]